MVGQAESIRGNEPGAWFWIEYLNPSSRTRGRRCNGAGETGSCAIQEILLRSKASFGDLRDVVTGISCSGPVAGWEVQGAAHVSWKGQIVIPPEAGKRSKMKNLATFGGKATT